MSRVFDNEVLLQKNNRADSSNIGCSHSYEVVRCHVSMALSY